MVKLVPSKALWRQLLSCLLWEDFIVGILLQKLKRLAIKYKADKTYPSTVAERPRNIKKNRYKDILPCEFHFSHRLVPSPEFNYPRLFSPIACCL